MKWLIERIWITYRIEAILALLGLALLAALICYIDPDWLSPSDTIQTMTLVVLVIVTLSYSRSTRKIYEVALNAEKNAVSPIISIVAEVTNPHQILISYENIGRGPALNFKIWLELDNDEQFRYLKSEEMKNRSFRAALGVGQQGQREWNSSEGVLPTRTSGIDIVAEYTDVFRQHFQSKLVIVNTYDQGFHFGKKKGQ